MTTKPGKNVVLPMLEEYGYTSDLWTALRSLVVDGEVTAVEWRQLWRKHHPNGQPDV